MKEGTLRIDEKCKGTEKGKKGDDTGIEDLILIHPIRHTGI